MIFRIFIFPGTGIRVIVEGVGNYPLLKNDEFWLSGMVMNLVNRDENAEEYLNVLYQLV